MSKSVFEEWPEARKEAQERADRTGMDVQLRAVRWYGKKLYVIRFLARKGRRFGVDLEGEVIEPSKVLGRSADR